MWSKILLISPFSPTLCSLFKCDVPPVSLSCRPNFPALSQPTFTTTLSQSLCHKRFPLYLHVHKHTGASHMLLHGSTHFFSCAHLRIKQMHCRQTEYSSSCSHKPVKAYRPRSYLCINLNLLWGSNLLKGNKAKGYIIIFGVDPTGLGGWLLAPLSTFLPSQNSHPTDKSQLPFLGLISSSRCLASNPKDGV